MDFKSACKLLSATQQNQLNFIIRSWSNVGEYEKKIVANLKNEVFLEEKSWMILLNEILNAHTVLNNNADFSWFDFLKKIKTTCQTTLLLKGGPVKGIIPKRIGVVISVESFETYLLLNHRTRFRDSDDFDFFYTNIRRRGHLPKDMEETLIKDANTLLWLVWDKDSADQDSPFSFALHKDQIHTGKLCTGLGLPQEQYKGEKLISLVFDVSKDEPHDLYRPTFADSELRYHFKPGKGDHGQTEPLNGGEVKIENIIYVVSPVPEAVQLSKKCNLARLNKLDIHQRYY